MDMNLQNGSDFIIVVANRKHKAEFLKIESTGECVFKIVERDHPHLHAHTGSTCSVLFTMDGKRCFFRGTITSQAVDTAIVFNATPIERDKRNDIRYQLTTIQARIRGDFPRTREISAHIMNINRTGAELSTSVPLEVNKMYELSFQVLRIPRPFSAVFTVQHCRKNKGFFLSGVLFDDNSILPAHRDTLDIFLQNI